MRSRKVLLAAALLAFPLFLLPAAYIKRQEIRAFIKGEKAVHIFTIEEQISIYEDKARPRLKAMFAAKNLHYPPEKVSFVGLKDKRQLQVYVQDSASKGKYRFLVSYPILGASGVLGPKLREGDRQVPEGLYIIESLEPNTPYHLGLRLNYPCDRDWQRAKEDGREHPGSDILIHGNTGSIGCLAMGDQTAEDLFVLAYDAKDHHWPVVLSPVDLRRQAPPPAKLEDPSWLPALYEDIRVSLAEYPLD